MAQYIAYINRNVSRLGTKKTGASAEARGWNIGGEAEAHWDERNQRDVVDIGVTSGTHGMHSPVNVATFAVASEDKVGWLELVDGWLKEANDIIAALVETNTPVPPQIKAMIDAYQKNYFRVLAGTPDPNPES